MIPICQYKVYKIFPRRSSLPTPSSIINWDKCYLFVLSTFPLSILNTKTRIKDGQTISHAYRIVRDREPLFLAIP